MVLYKFLVIRAQHCACIQIYCYCTSRRTIRLHGPAKKPSYPCRFDQSDKMPFCLRTYDVVTGLTELWDSDCRPWKTRDSAKSFGFS